LIKKRTDGKYYLYITDEFGKRIRRTFEKRADAEALKAKVTKIKYEKKLAGLSLRKARYSFEKALSDFEISKQNLRPTSVKKYRFAIKQFQYFIEACNILFLDEFTPDHGTLFYQELIREKIDPKGNTDKIIKPQPKTVNFHIQTIKAFFKDEVSKDHIPKSPVQHLKNLKNEAKKPEYYTLEELKRFFSQSMPPAYKNAFLCLFLTGMRFGELANLTWNDIDFQRRLIYVRPKDGFKTKTYNSERAIPINDELLNLLKSLNENKISEIYPFCSSDGCKMRERRALEICKRVARDAGIKSRAFLHKFRHTFATHLIQNNAPIESIKELLGHSSITETEIYAHNRPDHMHYEIQKLPSIYF
jgi:integrase